MSTIQLNLQKLTKHISLTEIESYQRECGDILNKIQQKSGVGNEFLGWIDLPGAYTDEFLEDIQKTADKLAKKSQAVVVVGIGGSYLGSRAVIDALTHQFSYLIDTNAPQILYAGHNLSEDYLHDLIQVLDNIDYSVIVISKSGTTIEPAIAFRILRQHLEKKYGIKKAAKRIVAITDSEKGALKSLADKQGYKTYCIPDDVGGRYSVFTPVGLLPMAVAGINIFELIDGAYEMQQITQKPEVIENPALTYAIARNIFYKKGKKIEILGSFMPNMQYIIEWWKQLYGESEGKERKGLFPASNIFTTDLHSLGQYIQEGERHIFETMIYVDNSNCELTVPKDSENLDNLNYLAGKKIHEVNKMAALGTHIAHNDGDVPIIPIEINKINAESIGQLLYFFEIACAISGYMLNVNPFNQPGVEAYKKNMFALLSKPGFETETEAILKRI